MCGLDLRFLRAKRAASIACDVGVAVVGVCSAQCAKRYDRAYEFNSNTATRLAAAGAHFEAAVNARFAAARKSA
jgi:hypothetical protein